MSYRKRKLRHVHPAKIQISLRIRAVWSESSLGTFWIAKVAKFLHADNEDADQTVRMCRLIWVVVEQTYQKVPFFFNAEAHSHAAAHFVIVLTKHACTNQAQIDWWRSNSKWYFYIYKSTQQETWNCFLSVFFLLLLKKKQPKKQHFTHFFKVLTVLDFFKTHCILNRISHTIYWKSPISVLGTSGYEIYIFLQKNG